MTPGRLVNVKAAAVETLVRHAVAQGDGPLSRRELRRVVGELALRLRAEKRRRERFLSKVGGACSDEYRADREAKSR